MTVLDLHMNFPMSVSVFKIKSKAIEVKTVEIMSKKYNGIKFLHKILGLSV